MDLWRLQLQSLSLSSVPSMRACSTSSAEDNSVFCCFLPLQWCCFKHMKLQCKIPIEPSSSHFSSSIWFCHWSPEWESLLVSMSFLSGGSILAILWSLSFPGISSKWLNMILLTGMIPSWDTALSFLPYPSPMRVIASFITSKASIYRISLHWKIRNGWYLIIQNGHKSLFLVPESVIINLFVRTGFFVFPRSNYW